MGEIAAQNSEEAKRKAYSFVVKDIKDGVMLTGTKSVQHLKENLSLFEKALSLKWPKQSLYSMFLLQYEDFQVS